MSAPSVAELGLLTGRDERRSKLPLNSLGRDLDTVVTHAVDPREIAAVLEAQGINDLQAQLRYETEDVFGTAEHLYRMAPYRPPTTHLERPRHALDWGLLRGVLYLLPALWFHDALRFLPPQQALIGLVAGILFGWGWTQGLSYLAFQHPGQAGALLARLGTLGILLGACLAASASVFTGSPALMPVLASLCVGTYFTASTLLMGLGRERMLVLSLLPGLLFTLGALVLDYLHRPFVRELALAGLALAVLVPALLTVSTLLRLRGVRSEARQSALRRSLPRSVPFALVGWLYAVFLSLDTLLAFVRQGPDAMIAQSVGAAPVVLCMGVMEWLSARQVGQMRYAAQTHSVMQALASRGARIFSDTALRYAVVLALVTLAWNLTLSLQGQGGPSALRLVGHLVYGLALLASVYLANGGRVWLTVPAWIVGVGVQFLVHDWLGPDTSYLTGGLCALLALLVFVRSALNDITSYR